MTHLIAGIAAAAVALDLVNNGGDQRLRQEIVKWLGTCEQMANSSNSKRE